MNAKEILDREFLEIRCKILEVGASLDRIDRASGDVADDRQAELLAAAIKILQTVNPDTPRAEQLQMLFSREYDANWQQEFQISSRA